MKPKDGAGTQAVLDAIGHAPHVAIPPTPAFARACADYGLELEPGEIERLGRFLALLLHVNQTVNLTAIRDPHAAWIQHVFDSLTLLPLLEDLHPRERIIDVGSGGGAPGIPLAITQPHSEVTLLESTGKKAAFLLAACERLRLANARVVPARAETYGRGEGRDRFDAAVARALGPLAVAAELTIPLVRVGGRVLLIKGERAGDELRQATRALTLLKAVHLGSVRTPTGTIVALEKTAPTPAAYPRRDGEPKRMPLGSRP